MRKPWISTGLPRVRVRTFSTRLPSLRAYAPTLRSVCFQGHPLPYDFKSSLTKPSFSKTPTDMGIYVTVGIPVTRDPPHRSEHTR